MSPSHVDRDTAVAQLLEGLVALQGRTVVVRVAGVLSPTDTIAGFHGSFGGWTSARDEHEGDDALFLPVGDGGIVVVPGRLTYVGSTDAGGVAYIVDATIVVTIDPFGDVVA